MPHTTGQEGRLLLWVGPLESRLGAGNAYRKGASCYTSKTGHIDVKRCEGAMYVGKETEQDMGAVDESRRFTSGFFCALPAI